MVKIEPNGLYQEEFLRVHFRFSGRALLYARRKEGLRCAQVGNRRLYTGQSILDWLNQKETQPRENNRDN